MDDILGLKPLLTIDFPWLPVLALAVGTLALLVIAFMLLRRWLKRPPAPIPEVIPVVQSPGELALQALRALEQSPVMERGESGLFYLQLEEILKRYIEASCHLPALSATRTELQQMMARQGLAAWERHHLIDLLERGTYAKFAGAEQVLTAMRNDVQIVRAFIHDDSRVGPSTAPGQRASVQPETR